MRPFPDFKIFLGEFSKFLGGALHGHAVKFETGKGVFVTTLYRQRGRMGKRLMHSSMAGITAFGVMVAPIIAEEFPGSGVDPWSAPSFPSVLSASVESSNTSTLVSDKNRGEIVEYEVQEGDTVSGIAGKFGLDEETILWQNSLTSASRIKPGQKLEILPVVGVSHKVRKGDTVYSIAKKYDIDPQGIIDFPFNAFVNDETFELAIGQALVVPGGIMPAVSTSGSAVATRSRQATPDAGTVVASGSFVWPTQGTISQSYAWYHKGIDIANRAAPNILAADSGTVIVAGWPDGYGYGNRVLIDHGNGMRTLYAHLSGIYVSVGQTVRRGDTIGRMGSTGRSTGTHLHFEVISGGVHLNPLSVLQ